MSANEKDNELDPLTAQLAALRPRTDRLDRDKLMFLAGRVSAERMAAAARSLRFWRGTAGAMTAVAAGLLVVLVCRHAPPAAPLTSPVAQTPLPTQQPANQLNDVRQPSPPKSETLTQAENPLSPLVFGGSPADWFASPILDPQSKSYLQMRAAVLAGRVDRLGALGFSNPTSDVQGTPRASNRQLLNSLLDEPDNGSPPRGGSMEPRKQGAHS